MLPLLFAVLIAGCQSDGTGTPEASAAPKNRCEELKLQSSYNTATGRAIANATCQGIFTKLSNKESTLWVHREHARQRGCQARTGKLCED